jgi:Ca-activated chloride channel family protein
MMALADFHFLRPWWLLAVLLLPLLGWAWRRQSRGAGAWGAFVDAHLLPHLIEQAPAHRHNAAAWLAAMAWMIACLALAGPAWEREPMPLFRNDAARILAIELSPTMLAGDVKPTRLERARFKINDILEASRDRETALIGYAGDAFVAAPLTSDVNTVRNLVDAMDPGIMPVVGNAPERAIAEAQRLLEQAGFKRGELILLADSSSAKAEAAARRAFAAGLRVSVLGVGTSKGAPVPLPQGGFLQDANGNIVLPRLAQAELEQLASAGGGRYVTLGNDRHDIDVFAWRHRPWQGTSQRLRAPCPQRALPRSRPLAGAAAPAPGSARVSSRMVDERGPVRAGVAAAGTGLRIARPLAASGSAGGTGIGGG